MMWVALMVAIGGILLLVLYDTTVSSDARARRALKRSESRTAAFRQRQLSAATMALTKIAAGDSGNPALDAQIALQDINTLIINELENK